MTYRVRLGGSPKDSGETFEDRDEDWYSVDLYGSDLPCDSQWGACPAGDDGAYYPVLSVE